MKLSVCTDAVFMGRNTAEAMEVVKACGINAIEFWAWQGKNIDEIAAQARKLDMEIAAHCTSMVSLTDPGRRADYAAGLRETLEVAAKLQCRRIISQVGDDTGAPREEQRQSLIDGLRQCVPMLEAAGATLVIEPLNTKLDHKSYFLSAAGEAESVVDAVGSPWVRILYDCYHQQITEGDIIRSLTRLGGKVGHIHIAGVPGRHEADTGELRYEAVFAALNDLGYGGYVGLEYFPQGEAGEGLTRLARMFQSI